jgi:hypothetical protein
MALGELSNSRMGKAAFSITDQSFFINTGYHQTPV